ncbi:MAG: hypothetical protein KDC71_01495 [Acidobacteria bacterium]|nr:hypothetical protein [Acidobacteriota bacterium]
MRALTLLLLLGACNSKPESQAVSAPPAPAKIELPTSGEILGIDVSHHDGPVDWGQVRQSGYHFAYVKATQGDDWVDPLFKTNFDGLKQAGLFRGAYHFFMVDDTGAEQARNFLTAVLHEPGDLAPVVDIETWHENPQPDVAEELRVFLDEVYAATGKKAVIYTNPRFWDTYLKEKFTDHPLWVAEYEVENPQVPTGWQTWTLWQYTENGTISGVGTEVDISRYNGDAQTFQAMIIQLAELQRTP